MRFSDSQTRSIEITEKVCSVFSLLGAVFIITTFISNKSFHRPINRLVFYAAWGNIMSNVATLISVSGIKSGVNGSLCQFQAFLIQWFMPADALWTLAMAWNVFLTFFRKYDAKELRLLEWRYILFCYGTPFIPAFTYFFIKSESHGKIYGSAVLWCWVSLDWDFLRIATFYGPVWLVIFATFAIYLSAGRVVLQWRRQLLKYARNTRDIGISSQCELPSPRLVKTNDFYMTSEPAQRSNTSHQLNFESNQARVSSESKPNTTYRNNMPRYSLASIDANSAAVSYCKCAILFFVALLVTWVPSTINRVVTLVHPDEAVFGLNYASGLVLPLQGFWNAVIYIFTSLPACRALMQSINTALTTGRMTRSTLFSTTADTSDIIARGSNKQPASCSESVQELRSNSGEGQRIAVCH